MADKRRVALACITPENEFSGASEMYPSYGVRRVQAAVLSLPASIPTEVSLFDLAGLSPNEAVRQLVDFAPDVLGFSAYMWSFPALFEIAREFKKVRPQCTVVFGGPSARPSMFSLPPFATAPSFVDAIALGEGEDVFQEIVSLGSRDAAGLASVKGIAVPSNGGWRETGTRPLLDPLDQIVSPYELGIMPRSRLSYGYLETYRGCPLACKFCEWGIATDAKRVFSKEYLVHELELLKSYGLAGVFHLDAGLNLNVHGFRNLRDAEEEVGFFRSHGLICEVYPSKMNEEYYAFLEQCRTEYIGIGLQSFDKEVLRLVDRPFTEQHFEPVVERLAKIAPVEIHLIIGLPGDSPEGFLRTFERVRKLPAHIRAYPCLVLPDALMTRSPAEFNIRFDPVTLRMTSCLGWPEESLSDMVEHMARLATSETESGRMSPQSANDAVGVANRYWIQFPRPGNLDYPHLRYGEPTEVPPGS